MPPFPTVRQPFPVKVPFTTAVDLYKLGRPLYDAPDDTVFLYEQHTEHIIQAKLDALRQIPDHSLCFLDDDLPGLTAALWAIAARVADEHPAWATVDETGFTSRLLGVWLGHDGGLRYHADAVTLPELGAAVHAYLETLMGVRRLAAGLLLAVQEDLVVMRNATGATQGDEAEALMVALPTHWDPKTKLGQNFGQIHVPVGDNQRLLDAHPRLMRVMLEKGPFVRYSWSLGSAAQLCQNPVLLDAAHSMCDPSLLDLAPPDLLARLVFRVERQTILAMSDLKRSLFAIGVYQRPLTAVIAEEPGRAAQLADAVASMSAAQRAYKSLDRIGERLVAALRQHA
jgi:hypothetical protein